MPDGKQDLFVSDGSGEYTPPYKVYNRLVKIGPDHYELMIFPDDTAFVYQTPTGAAYPTLPEIRDAGR
ncbi:MAG: hypothetical protein CR976_01050 [Thiotrichales bacterium]|nr:MAG: hypothetical protein CR976_01050 [Thiotrichales bacterium]